MVVVILGFLLVVVFGHFYKLLVWRPQRVRSKMLQQGIGGPSPTSFLVGNIPEMKAILVSTMKQKKSDKSLINHHWPPSVFPHLHAWTNQYGPTFVYSTGSIQLLCTTDAELVKQISLFGEAFLPIQGSWAFAGPGHSILKRPNLGPPEEDHCSGILHGQDQGHVELND